MEKTQLFCKIEEKEYPFYTATFFLSNGQTESGKFYKEFFKGNSLEVGLLEHDGEIALVVLPKSENNPRDLALVKEKYLLN